jgi:hypothetical protein
LAKGFAIGNNLISIWALYQQPSTFPLLKGDQGKSPFFKGGFRGIFKKGRIPYLEIHGIDIGYWTFNFK